MPIGDAGGNTTQVRNWLSRVFGRGDDSPSPVPAPSPSAAVAVHTPLHGADERHPAASSLGDAQVAFLLGLTDPPDARALDELPQDDRVFIAGVQRRLRTRELELPALPEMAIRLSQLFHEGAAVPEFVTLVNRDASLSIEVLRAANSSFYAAARPVTALQDAIVRIGLNRLQAILMLAHMRGKVLKGGAFKAEADLLFEMALPMGHLASRVARVTCLAFFGPAEA